MTKKAQRSKPAADKVAKNILRKNWHSYSSEEKTALFWLGYGRRKIRSFVPSRGDRRELVLQLVEGIF
jgi:hypothetical protein